MNSLLGHEKNIAKLAELLETSHLPHALLFAGPEGVGKKNVARALAKKILAEKKLSDDHPDFIFIEPEKGRIKIDTIREIKKTLNFAPLKSKHRVVLLNNAHSMNTAAANALLKSLEEPPEHTYFILVTHALGWLPKTIASRCQKFNFSPLNKNHLKQILTDQNIELSEERISWAQGSIARAQALAELGEDLPNLRLLLPSRAALGFDQIHTLVKNAVDAGKTESFLQGLLSATHHVLTHPRKNDQYDFDLLNFAARIMETQNTLRQNINAKMHLTRLLLYFQEPKASRL